MDFKSCMTHWSTHFYSTAAAESRRNSCSMTDFSKKTLPWGLQENIPWRCSKAQGTLGFCDCQRFSTKSFVEQQQEIWHCLVSLGLNRTLRCWTKAQNSGDFLKLFPVFGLPHALALPLLSTLLLSRLYRHLFVDCCSSHFSGDECQSSRHGLKQLHYFT